ncbi:MAG TPA: GAF domain-containing protein [Ohtaekwangia sp.]
MTGLLDRYNLNLILTVFFILGIGFSFYMIYSLPADLRLTDGYQPELLEVYIMLALTFIFGVTSTVMGMRYKKEIVVFRDRIDDTTTGESTEASNKTTISLEGVKSSLNQSRGTKETLQAGLHAICKQLDAGQGALYLTQEDDGKRKIELKSGYALTIGESTVISYEFGEGLIGQSAAGGRTLYIDDVPDGYIKIISGLGSASPRYLLIVPIRKKEHIAGVLEVATFTSINEDQRKFVEESAQLIADKISTQA